MKKILALLLALTMVLSMAACGSKGGTETTAPANDATTLVATEAQDDATYTYDVNLSEFPTLWNPHTYTK